MTQNSYELTKQLYMSILYIPTEATIAMNCSFYYCDTFIHLTDIRMIIAGPHLVLPSKIFYDD